MQFPRSTAVLSDHSTSLHSLPLVLKNRTHAKKSFDCFYIHTISLIKINLIYGFKWLLGVFLTSGWPIYIYKNTVYFSGFSFSIVKIFWSFRLVSWTRNHFGLWEVVTIFRHFIDQTINWLIETIISCSPCMFQNGVHYTNNFGVDGMDVHYWVELYSTVLCLQLLST